MGSVGCATMCTEWISSLPLTQQKLTDLYRKDLKDNRFSRIAINTLR